MAAFDRTGDVITARSDDPAPEEYLPNSLAPGTFE